MRLIVFFACLTSCISMEAQPFKLQIQPVLSNEKIVLGQSLNTHDGDSLTISMLKFYLGNFEFWKNGQMVFAQKTYHLLDLEDEASLLLPFDLTAKTAFDSIVFLLGVDSLTTTTGAMGGDLDPTRGMFWSWQSGYINFKIEGFSSKCPAREGAFEFHLGGFMPPVQAFRRINAGEVRNLAGIRLDFDLAPFFHKIDWQKKPSIMSPGAEAARLAGVLANSFARHEK